ncbi:BASIC LEUCINE ZIPPER 23 [Salix viminalis]|uniref:BASIC LEUCINE ZIPPER 23 n=1 Tax=Salix viminalis TaxID=40686 RepID=A0A9Q0QJU8_SALVM|nr:BASIC LEUCINE ZIPPER 23 [Salix viminalis]
MDDGELDFSNQELLSSPNLGEIPSSCSFDFLDELLKDTHACTHTHTCNPPGPDYSHTHTCYHVHTKILPPTEDKVVSDDTAESTDKKSKKRSSGNREAVRKYREKKKAKAASLEDEVKHLRALNQQLLKRLQGQTALEAEKSATNVNLANPNAPGALVMNPCNIQCDGQIYCQNPVLDSKGGEDAALNGQGFSSCEFENLQCMEYQNSGMIDLSGCSLGNVATNGNSSGTNKRKKGIVEQV